MNRAEDPVAAAKDAALRALGSRDLTRAELIELLIKRHEPQTVDAAVLELETVGVVDDRRVASQYVQSRLEQEKPARAALEAELLERGVDPGLVESVLHEAMMDVDE